MRMNIARMLLTILPWLTANCLAPKQRMPRTFRRSLRYGAWVVFVFQVHMYFLQR